MRMWQSDCPLLAETQQLNVAQFDTTLTSGQFVTLADCRWPRPLQVSTACFRSTQREGSSWGFKDGSFPGLSRKCFCDFCVVSLSFGLFVLMTSECSQSRREVKCGLKSAVSSVRTLDLDDVDFKLRSPAGPRQCWRPGRWCPRSSGWSYPPLDVRTLRARRWEERHRWDGIWRPLFRLKYQHETWECSYNLSSNLSAY